LKVKMLIGGKWKSGDRHFEVRNRYDGSLVAEAPLASEGDVSDAVASAVNGLRQISGLPPHKRADILHKTSLSILGGKEDISRTIVAESGKPVRYALAEVERAAETFQFAAEEAKRIHGETIPMGASKGSENR